MKGKVVILIIVLVTVIAMLLTWWFMENIIEDYDVDRKSLEESTELFI
ncbi:hypothetical protein [Oceanobacillus profundus]|nr:hypothetical protein [Oceanobacillus profundus]MBR3120877.1 hypothetical protein [Oceanobacillus sp.]MCM3400370.1 hypothetical protein [Oceanobacillus profundus]MDO6451763.1 hypothetical protein [Oceanobacillus profundus]